MASELRVSYPIAAELSRITRLHDPDYVQALLEGTLSAAKMRRIGFPWSKPLIERTLYSVGGTCLTVEQALQSGVAIHLSGVITMLTPILVAVSVCSMIWR